MLRPWLVAACVTGGAISILDQKKPVATTKAAASIDSFFVMGRLPKLLVDAGSSVSCIRYDVEGILLPENSCVPAHVPQQFGSGQPVPIQQHPADGERADEGRHHERDLTGDVASRARPLFHCFLTRTSRSRSRQP